MSKKCKRKEREKSISTARDYLVLSTRKYSKIIQKQKRDLETFGGETLKAYSYFWPVGLIRFELYGSTNTVDTFCGIC